MKKYGIHIAISVVALVLAAAHLLWPNAKIDVVILTLLAIAVLPWLGSIFRSVELPGGLKVEYKDLQKAGEKAKQAGLLAAPRARTEEPAYLAVAERDSNLALAGLRIEIERRLQALAQSHGIESKGKGMRQLLNLLRDGQVLSAPERGALADMTNLLNNAVHGADVDSKAAEWAMETGSRLLAALDERIK